MKNEHVKFQCDECGIVTDRMNKLNSHKKTKHEDMRLESDVVREKSDPQTGTEKYHKVKNLKSSEQLENEAKLKEENEGSKKVEGSTKKVLESLEKVNSSPEKVLTSYEKLEQSIKNRRRNKTKTESWNKEENESKNESLSKNGSEA